MRLIRFLKFITLIVIIVVGCMKQPVESNNDVFFCLNFKYADHHSESSRIYESTSERIVNHPILTKPNGLVVENVLVFHFDEDSGTVLHDITPYRNEGSIIGAEWTESARGPALRFDGTSYVEVQNATSLNPTHHLEIAAQFNVADVTASPEIAIVNKFHIRGIQGNGYTLGISNGALFFSVTQNGRVWSITDNVILENNQWYTGRGVYDGSRLKLFLNSEEKISVEMSGLLNYSDVPLVIGASSGETQDDYTNFFTGMINEVRIRTGVEYEDFDIIRVAVIDLSQFQRWEDFWNSQLARDYEHEWQRFRQSVDEVVWEGLLRLWRSFFRIASDQSLQIRGAFAEGNIPGVEGLNRIEVAAIRGGRIVYRGSVDVIGIRGRTIKVEILLLP